MSSLSADQEAKLGDAIKGDVHEESQSSEGGGGDRRLRLRRTNGQFNVLSTEVSDFSERLSTSTLKSPDLFWGRVLSPVPLSLGKSEDPYLDYIERQSVKRTKTTTTTTTVPSLKECRSYLRNDEAEAYQRRSEATSHRFSNVILDFLSAIFMYLVNTLSLESTLAVANAVLATYIYGRDANRWSAKLDFAFLAFSVVFPLTFLIQSVFSRRDQALQRLADFKGAVLAAALMTLTCDWAASDGSSKTMGRLELPPHFNKIVVQDFRELVQLVYEYLSMPQVSHARNVVFLPKRSAVRRVHALQNSICRKINDSAFDLTMHTEFMRKYGFPSGEASRLHQYHQYLQQRFEQLRILKYYRTPQATRSFGRAYLIILPWIMGPYFAWVHEETNDNYQYTLFLAGFTFLILIGLLNTVRGLEDPFVAEMRGWTPGIDNVKLEFECATILQGIEQYYANAERHQASELKNDRENSELGRMSDVGFDV